MEQQIHRLGSVGDGGGSEDHFLSSFLVISVEAGLGVAWAFSYDLSSIPIFVVFLMYQLDLPTLIVNASQ
jgi:hypothetical protein